LEDDVMMVAGVARHAIEDLTNAMEMSPQAGGSGNDSDSEPEFKVGSV
jgi:hypothetical protein